MNYRDNWKKAKEANRFQLWAGRQHWLSATSGIAPAPEFEVSHSRGSSSDDGLPNQSGGQPDEMEVSK